MFTTASINYLSPCKTIKDINNKNYAVFNDYYINNKSTLIAIYYNDNNTATIITDYAAINSGVVNNWSESIVGKDGLQHTIILGNY